MFDVPAEAEEPVRPQVQLSAGAGALVRHRAAPEQGRPAAAVPAPAAAVAGVRLQSLRLASDGRGSLTAGEIGRDVPFAVRRYFLVFDVPNAELRGEHAHHSCEQFLVAVKGSVNVMADDGRTRQAWVLDRPNVGLYLPRLTWAVQSQHSPDAVLLVLASEFYDPRDYIRSYTEFLAHLGQRQAP